MYPVPNNLQRPKGIVALQPMTMPTNNPDIKISTSDMAPTLNIC